MDTTALPPTSELYTRRQLSERHPHLLPESRIIWALRHRHINGLAKAAAVFDTPAGLVVHEPRFLAWFLSRGGRGKPRRLRRAVAA